MTYLTLNSLVEFDCPFTVRNGQVEDAHDAYAPTVMHDDDEDIVIGDDAWEAFSTGYTAQYGYNGPVMHNSEILGGRLAKDILAEDGTYVLVAVGYWDEDDEMNFEGWVVLRLKD